MTRYFLFKYADCYPEGGFSDLAGVYDSEEDALDAIGNGPKVDNIKLYSLDDDSNEPQLLWYQVCVWGSSYNIENEDTKIIKMPGEWNSVLMRPQEAHRGE